MTGNLATSPSQQRLQPVDRDPVLLRRSP